MDTLPDLLAPGLRLLSIGLNPSLPSVAAGFYFANPRNRFWRALNASELLGAPLQPGVAAMTELLHREAIGFTDVVKRPTRGAGELRAQDYREGVPILLGHIEQFQPACAWFHGKVAYRHFLRYAQTDTQECEWGQQRLRIGTTRLYVTPNPSPANAAWSLEALIGWYNRLAKLTGVAH